MLVPGAPMSKVPRLLYQNPKHIALASCSNRHIFLMACVVLKGMASGYQVKQVMLQRAAAGVPQVSRISSPHPCLACGRQPDGCRAGSNGLSQARLTHRGKGSDSTAFETQGWVAGQGQTDPAWGRVAQAAQQACSRNKGAPTLMSRSKLRVLSTAAWLNRSERS